MPAEIAREGGLFINNWGTGRAHISAAFLAAVGVLVWLVRRAESRRVAVWSLVVLATIVAFGYVNETRHYLLLVAFWIAYAWPVEATIRPAGRRV